MNMLQKLLAGVFTIGLTTSVNAADIKKVSDLKLGSYHQEHQPALAEEALSPRYVELKNTTVNFNNQIDSKGFIIFKTKGIPAKEHLDFKLYVRSLEQGFIEVGTVIDYNDNGVTFQLSYDAKPDYLYLSTNDNLDNTSLLGNPDHGQDITKSKMAAHKPFDGKVEFYLSTDAELEINTDVTLTVSQVIGQDGTLIDTGNTVETVLIDLQNTMKPVVNDNGLAFTSDFDISKTPQQRFDLTFNNIPDGFTLQVNDEVCIGGEVCEMTIYMSPTAPQPVVLNKPDMYLDYEITVDTVVNSKHPLQNTVVFEGESNTNTYTVPYSYHIQSNSAYYTVFNMFTETNTPIYFDIVLTKAGNGINKEVTTYTDVEFYALDTVSTFTLKTLLDLVEVEEGNYHAKVIFKSHEKITLNVDNVSPTGRTTINVEKQESDK